MKLRYCGCGCGRRVGEGGHGQVKFYVDASHRARAYRRRRGLEPWPKGGSPYEPRKTYTRRSTPPVVHVRLLPDVAKRLLDYLDAMPVWSDGTPTPASAELQRAIERFERRVTA